VADYKLYECIALILIDDKAVPSKLSV
jgi:hypothetical protein